MNTLPSCPHVAIVFIGSPMFALHATSLTQSPCARSACSSFHWFDASSNRHTLARLSHPPVTNRLTVGAGALPPAATSDPGGAAGAQLTPVHPIECAPGILLASHDPSARFAITLAEPSDDAAARTNPCSCGAHAIAFTLASCSVVGDAYACEKTPCSDSFQMMILLSNEHDAR
eukprot:2460-Pelagococcus_subviridis.AAC.1